MDSNTLMQKTWLLIWQVKQRTVDEHLNRDHIGRKSPVEKDDRHYCYLI